MLGQEQLQQALTTALQAGPERVAEQVRYVLALSHKRTSQIDAAFIGDGEPPARTSVDEARLGVLVSLAHTLRPEQRLALLADVRRLKSAAACLEFTLTLVPLLPAGALRNVTAPELWGQITDLTDPLARSRSALRFLAALPHLQQHAPMIATTMIDTVNLALALPEPEARVRSLAALAPHLPPEQQMRILGHMLDVADSTRSDRLIANTLTSLVDRLPLELEDRAIKSARVIRSPVERARAFTALARAVAMSRHGVIRDETLRAIEAIAKEPDRVSALSAFAPHLEAARHDSGYPNHLEDALRIALAITQRGLRAQALVALAPHLTLDLQGEALAAVHNLRSERDRARLLAELAPTLPPNMLVASLAVAHTMREQDSRVHALTVLAHYVPEQARAQTVLDALAAAANLPHHFERVTALVALLDIVPPHLLDQTLTNALETSRLVENENARARALSLLGPYLTPALLLRTLETARSIEDPQQQLNALLGIVPHLPPARRGSVLAAMLTDVQRISIDYKRARALISLAPHLPPDLIGQAVRMTARLPEPYDRVMVFIALAQNLPRESRSQVLVPAWQLIQTVDDHYDRASALAAIAPYLPNSARPELAARARDVIRDIEDEYDKASAMSILAPLLVYGDKPSGAALPTTQAIIETSLLAALAIPQPDLRAQQIGAACSDWRSLDDDSRYAVWRVILPELAALPLADTLLCLEALLPVIESFGAQQSAEIVQILGLK